MATFQGNMDEIKRRLAQKLRELPHLLGEEAVNFSRQSFDVQGWQGAAMQPWKLRKAVTKWGRQDDRGRAILIKSGAGRRSIRILKVQENRVRIAAGGEAAPYMKAHNFGFRGQVAQNVNAFTRKMKNGKTQQVKAHTRTIHQNLPKRQFIGNSPYLKRRLQRLVTLELKSIFK